MTRRLFADLAPGDTFTRADADGTPTACTVVSTGHPYRDPFGRDMYAVLARRNDTGAVGLVPYGPGGFTETPDTDTEPTGGTMPDLTDTLRTVATVELHAELPAEFILDAWDAAGYGLTYWAQYPCTVDDELLTYAVTVQNELADGLPVADGVTREGNVWTITADRFAVALTWACGPDADLSSDYVDDARRAVLEADAGEIDSGLGETLVQYAAFGTVVFS